ncbi:hypothetical protein [Alcanivorax sp.]|uniref:hypothetical protein n=1 Tax=Alcanivorax sp. TaxID=1872427 RepID=UPI00258E5F9B|nr:hypothetical protein [Alcanivorax sp.]
MKIDSVVKALMQWGKEGHKVEVKLTAQPDGTLSIYAKGDSHPDHPDWTSGFSSEAKVTHPDEFAEQLFLALNPSDSCHGLSNMSVYRDLCGYLEYVLNDTPPFDIKAHFLVEKERSTAYHLIGLVVENLENDAQTASFTCSMALQGSGGGLNMMEHALRCLTEHDIPYEFLIMDNDRLYELLKNPSRFNEYVTRYGTYLDHIDENHPLWDSDWLSIKNALKRLKKKLA